MKRDPAIEEIRATRQEISAEFGHDTRALLRHYREMEKEYADRMIRNRLPAHPEAPPNEKIVDGSRATTGEESDEAGRGD